MAGRPMIGLLGIMQALYDEVLTGITERHAGYAKVVAAHLKDVAQVSFLRPAKSWAEIEEIVEGFEKEKLHGSMIVMLTYGPAMRATRALAESRLPLRLASIQPEPVVKLEWDMGDMTYNRGVHGAQDTADAMVGAGVPIRVVTEDWRSATFKVAFEDWARLPALEMPYGFFRPETGARGCLNGWLQNGGTHHQVMTLGLHAERWRLFAELLGIDYVWV